MLFYVLGEMMSLLIGKLIPGSVCGMILLFIALTLKWIRPHDVDKAASALTRNMALFFGYSDNNDHQQCCHNRYGE